MIALLSQEPSAWGARKRFYGALASTWLPLAWVMRHTPQRGGTVGFGLGVSTWEYLQTQCKALTIYLKLSFWPHPLVIDYGTGIVKSLNQVWPQSLIIATLLAATFYALWRRPALGFCGACFFAILAPSSSVVPLVTQTIAEHRMYLPLAAITVLTIYGLYALIGRWIVAVGTIVVVIFIALTVQRNAVYQDELTLWADSVAHWPANERAHNNLGLILSNRQQTSDAIRHYQEAIRLRSDYGDAHNNLGVALMAANQPHDAIAHYEKALQIKPDDFAAHANLAEALLRFPDRATEATGHYRAALSIFPQNSELHFGLAKALVAQSGHEAEAIATYEAALNLKADYVDAHVNLGTLLLKLPERKTEAITHYETALRLNPQCAPAHFNLALTLADQPERQAEMIAHYEAALNADPNFLNAHLNFGNLLLTIPGRLIDAIAHYEAALQINPDCAPAHYDLAIALLQIGGRENTAVAHCSAALRIDPTFKPAIQLATRLHNR